MYRRWISSFGKLVLLIALLLTVFIFVNRNTRAVLKTQSVSSTPNTTSTVQNVHFTKGTIANTTSSVYSDFQVFNLNCKIPRVDPFSTESMRWFQKPKFTKCSTQPDLVSVRYDRNKRQYILHINESVPILLYPNVSEYGCTYTQLMRGGNDSHVRECEPIYFDQEFEVPRHFMGIVVRCHDLNNKSLVLQHDAFAFVQYPKNRNEKTDAERSRTHPSVIMLGIDSMSQINFQRTMPLTAQFVRQVGWYEMLGYNKIGDNTLPNILALLTGRTPKQWKKYCDLKKPGCLDALTYLWNHFHNAGYLTAYAEDTPAIDTFNYRIRGFKKPPVDYYLRPFLTGIEMIMDKVIQYGYSYCVGRRQSFSYIFDYCQQLVQRFIQETPKPLFGIFWTNCFSHDDYTGPASVDADFVKYLEQYKQIGLFERAIVILFSDHGQRQGPLMALSSSFLEERLPMLHIYLPPWYRKQYPEVAQALDLNRHRLCSPYDLHMTIKDMLVLSHPRLSFSESPHCTGCQTLFQVLPEQRSCKEAFISPHWCTCEPYIQEPINQSLEFLAKLIVYRMNQYLIKNNYDKQCYRLKLGTIETVERKLLFDNHGHRIDPDDGKEFYRFKFTTQPNDGKFRATIKSNIDPDVVEIKEEFITRLNSYRNDSYCVKEHTAQKFCVCLKKFESFTNA